MTSSKAECLNNFFASQSRIDISKEPDLPSDVHYRTDSRLSDVSVSDSIIYNILTSLNTDKATGPEGIGNIILKNCAQSMCVPINIIASKSFESGIFPNTWKSANVVPEYKKKGEKQSPSNYRPISLLSSMSRSLSEFYITSCMTTVLFTNYCLKRTQV